MSNNLSDLELAYNQPSQQQRQPLPLRQLMKSKRYTVAGVALAAVTLVVLAVGFTHPLPAERSVDGTVTTQRFLQAAPPPPSGQVLSPFPPTAGGAAATGAAGAAAPSGDLTNFQPNPLGLSADDIDFIVKVRQAGLWEAPASQQALQRGNSALVKAAAKTIEKNHLDLDEQVRCVADKLGVLLPSMPNAEQQAFLTEMQGKMGDDFDVAFANNIRFAHGKVFTLIGKVRSTTLNPLVREFASAAVVVVMNHMKLAEDTGLVLPQSFKLTK